MSEVNRDTTVHFFTKRLQGLTNREVLASLEEVLDRGSIKGIQLTTSECLITLTTNEVKRKVLINGLVLRERQIQLVDVDRSLTTVTIKDAPIELSDQYIATCMEKYGKVVSGTLKRGTIKGTDIETGTRYIQLIDAILTIPNTTSFGNYTVRLFCDNDRTKCIYCEQSDHPHFRCPTRVKRCYKCNDTTHLAKDCTGEIRVSKNRLTHSDRSTAWDANWHTVGKKSNEHSQSKVNIPGDSSVVQRDIPCSDPGTVSKQQVKSLVFGASNCARVKQTDSSIKIISKSGATSEDIHDLIKMAHDEGVVDSDVNDVIISLGTNDVTRNRNNPDTVNINLTEAMGKVQDSYPGARVTVSSILPRNITGQSGDQLNRTGKIVNSFMQKFCQRHEFQFIDNDTVFLEKGKPNGKLFDKDGLHVNTKGAKTLMDTFIDCVNDTNKLEALTVRKKKRPRSESSLNLRVRANSRNISFSPNTFGKRL